MWIHYSKFSISDTKSKLRCCETFRQFKNKLKKNGNQRRKNVREKNNAQTMLFNKRSLPRVKFSPSTYYKNKLGGRKHGQVRVNWIARNKKQPMIVASSGGVWHYIFPTRILNTRSFIVDNMRASRRKHSVSRWNHTYGAGAACLLCHDFL